MTELIQTQTERIKCREWPEFSNPQAECIAYGDIDCKKICISALNRIHAEERPAFDYFRRSSQKI